MDTEDTFRGDSYCGLYCGACEVLNLYRDSLATGKPASWEDLPGALKEVIDPASSIVCRGCKTDLVSPGCRDCVIRACAREKNVEACVLCPDSPCKLVSDRKAYISENLEAILPHIKAKFPRAERIRAVGFETWRGEQARRWACPECGTPFTWYQKTCGRCGRELEPLKEHNRRDEPAGSGRTVS
ncbi:MAG TPA: DUF3795 domain-containing protein [Spirochaetia bacterium]|nr:DUF3795 domain-containing protein [Spirochaetales bacterium]HRY80711.1 DUF3795 domain-containing protein [Spirochaetia bacterium]HRZ89465.1 DUF3795 domain-containing protein [Spirochaetia bacterium]